MSRIFGAITQNGYVVRDIEAAMRHWIEVLGVGPWFYVERAPIEDFQYQGQPSPVDVSIAMANSGALQIELIEQRNDAPRCTAIFCRPGTRACNMWPIGRRHLKPIWSAFYHWATPLDKRATWGRRGALPICRPRPTPAR